MVLFLKGCSTEIVEDGSHQEGEVQAGWEECSKFCSLSIFLHVLKKGLTTREILVLQLGELQLRERCMFLTVLVIIHGQKQSENWGLSTSVVFWKLRFHYRRSQWVGEILSLGY